MLHAMITLSCSAIDFHQDFNAQSGATTSCQVPRRSPPSHFNDHVPKSTLMVYYSKWWSYLRRGSHVGRRQHLSLAVGVAMADLDVTKACHCAACGAHAGGDESTACVPQDVQVTGALPQAHFELMADAMQHETTCS